MNLDSLTSCPSFTSGAMHTWGFMTEMVVGWSVGLFLETTAVGLTMGSICTCSSLVRFVVPGGRNNIHAPDRDCSRVQRGQLEFLMNRGERRRDVLLLRDKRDVAFRGTLRDRDDVYIFPTQGGKCASDRPSPTHVFPNYGNNGDGQVESDVFYLLVGQVLRKFMAQRLHGTFGNQRGDHQTNIVLRGGLRDQEDIRSYRCGGRESA